jgi:putative ABC transport system permease protein
VQIVRGNRNSPTVLWGTTADYFTIREWPLQSGRHFLPEEEAGAGKKLILGDRIANRLFDTEHPIGAEVRVENVPFQVIGVLTEKGSMGAGRSLDDDVFAPISTANRRVRGSLDDVNRDAVEFILVKIASETAMDHARLQIEALLHQRHGLRPGQQSFQISDPAAQMAVQQDTTTTFAWLLTSVASISLLVGGISIMNIMLVSVRERTREIGLRIAVGARRRDVRNQFLMEAVTLCLSGGLIGIALGLVATALVAQAAGWPVLIGLDGVALAMGFSVAIGIFFGWYPAHKAASLQPVDALRGE